MVYFLNGESWEPHSTYQYVSEMGKRAFKQTTNDWPHAGCNPEDLAKFVREALAAKISAEAE